MDLQNLAYALTQVLHNFGAVTVAGGAIFALWPRRQIHEWRHVMAWLILLAWVVQGVSGAGFGIVSYLYYGQFPDIHGVAVAALLLKMACTVGGFMLAAAYVRYAGRWPESLRMRIWYGLLVLGVAALTAAAFLRWFS